MKIKPVAWSNKRVAVIGAGPAGLMAASVLSDNGVKVTLIEKRKSIARKLLIAGSSGLNVTYEANLEELVKHYTGAHKQFWIDLFTRYSQGDWLGFIEKLGLKTFLGTSRRYFIEDMKAPRLISEWKEYLKNKGVEFYLDLEVQDFDSNAAQTIIKTPKGELVFDAVCFSMGGGSWEPEGEILTWPNMFSKKNIRFIPFRASNVGYEVNWKEAFLKEAVRTPLKRVVLSTDRGKKMGELMITEYGIEGTPVYFVGACGRAQIDLKPEMSVFELVEKMNKVKENWSPLRRAQKKLNLSETAMALLFHHAPKEALKDVSLLAQNIKSFEIDLQGARPLSEAISSAGGVSFDECDERLMLKKMPGVFLAGEMLDWDAPTGGFLIQACVSQGVCAAHGIMDYWVEK